MTDEELIAAAEEAAKRAYAPYSHFCVGAAAVMNNDTGEKAVFTGCNIENAAFSPTMCAERVAVADGVKNGFRHIVKIAVFGEKANGGSQLCPPCGVCRQVINEFADDKTEILLSDGKNLFIYSIEEMLPLSFGKNSL